MYFADIKICDVGDGPGIRTSLFVSGCSHFCKNCFNPEAWDYNYGKPYTSEIESMILDQIRPSYIAGLTILGGEPCDPKNIDTVYSLCDRVKNLYKDEKSIWVYTGYTIDQLYRNYCGLSGIKLLSLIDVLVDGEYKDELHNDALKFRGSSNQRIIDLKKTMPNIKSFEDFNDKIVLVNV